MNALDYVTKFETDCLHLLHTLTSETTNPELKELYELLGETRQRHMDSLLSLHGSMGDANITSDMIDRAGQVDNACHIMLSDPDMRRAMRNDPDAYNHVIHAEEEMIRLCTGMARVEKSEEARALLNWFVEDEKKCLNEIEEIYDFVESPHCYLEWGEFSNLRSL